MAKTRRTGTTYRITSLPRRLYYKTKRVITTPIRKKRTNRASHTNGATTSSPTTTNTHRRHPKLFGGFKRGRTRQTQPDHNTKTHHFFGYTIKKDRNRNRNDRNNNNNNNNNNNHGNNYRHHHTIKSKLRSLLH
ncbi:hypothetical protein RclHR1_02510027 [Rhizophagus clarus]|uniref:Uncharacterized protein n=1 Tax=Rhizophagus clarus TaxID=94130 RepID=A0A2Z6QYR5_9GLOM|nr:hypothetical protein RclHR1_02510027 [Rhizophagus clarus]GES98612.1 hypothetical protein GLOIN_2v1484032 [Rhizophagus clarus]